MRIMDLMESIDFDQKVKVVLITQKGIHTEKTIIASGPFKHFLCLKVGILFAQVKGISVDNNDYLILYINDFAEETGDGPKSVTVEELVFDYPAYIGDDSDSSIDDFLYVNQVSSLYKNIRELKVKNIKVRGGYLYINMDRINKVCKLEN